MYRIVFILFSTLIFIQCNKNSPDINVQIIGKYVHQIEGCDSSLGSEVSCTEFIQFFEDGRLDLLYGGSDIAIQGTYEIKDKEITVILPPWSSFAVTFTIVDDDNIQRTDNGNLWTRQE